MLLNMSGVWGRVLYSPHTLLYTPDSSLCVILTLCDLCTNPVWFFCSPCTIIVYFYVAFYSLCTLFVTHLLMLTSAPCRVTLTSLCVGINHSVCVCVCDLSHCFLLFLVSSRGWPGGAANITQCVGHSCLPLGVLYRLCLVYSTIIVTIHSCLPLGVCVSCDNMIICLWSVN